MTAPALPAIRLVPLTVAALEALAEADFETADTALGLALPPIVQDNAWLWQLRREQIGITPGDLHWISRILVTEDGVAIGHAGFHGGPDEAGMVECGYSVEGAHRGRGYAKAALAEMVAWARRDGDVRTLRATVSPDNAASLAIVRGAGLVQDGEQWDERDGLELIFEMLV